MELESLAEARQLFKNKATIFTFFRRCLILEEEVDVCNHYTVDRDIYGAIHGQCRVCGLTLNLSGDFNELDLFEHLHNEHTHDFARAMLLLDDGEELPNCECHHKSRAAEGCVYNHTTFNVDEICSLNYVSSKLEEADSHRDDESLMGALKMLAPKENTGFFSNTDLFEKLMEKVRLKLNCFPKLRARLQVIA
jgi:hypothetical protein